MKAAIVTGAGTGTGTGIGAACALRLGADGFGRVAVVEERERLGADVQGAHAARRRA